MHVAAHCTVFQRDEGGAHEHVPQADAEEQSILIHAVRAERGHVKWVGDERIGESRQHGFQSFRRILFDDDRHDSVQFGFDAPGRKIRRYADANPVAADPSIGVLSK